jgi:hypothetical protein
VIFWLLSPVRLWIPISRNWSGKGMRVAIVEEAGKQLKSSDGGYRKGIKENTEDKGKKESRAPQLVTINGQKVTHAHAFPEYKEPGHLVFHGET